jgi:hypothetical protein
VAKTTRGRAWHDFKHGFGRKAGISLGASVVLGAGVWLAVDRWGSKEGAGDALIGLLVAAGAFVVIVTTTYLVLLSIAPRRNLTDRVTELERAAGAAPPPKPPQLTPEMEAVNDELKRLFNSRIKARCWPTPFR